jgi:prepilin-type N-terminal cleavage/methylation domain-containing protein
MRYAQGFSLIEVLVATAILTIGVTALAQLVTIAMRVNASARATTSAVLLAQAKMEQLRSLAWGVDANGAPISDLTSDVAAMPDASSGGVGLTPSPPDALVAMRAGYYDFVDSSGHALGGGGAPPADARYLRRWSIEPVDAFAESTLTLRVRVTRVQGSASGAVIGASRQPDEARLVSIKTRKAW